VESGRSHLELGLVLREVAMGVLIFHKAGEAQGLRPDSIQEAKGKYPAFLFLVTVTVERKFGVLERLGVLNK
jgi:hypothetical protein